MWRILTVSGLVACVVAPFLPPSASRPDQPDIGITVLAGTLLLCAALSLSKARMARAVAAAAALTCTAWAAVWLVADVEEGLPGAAIGVLAAGAFAVGIGATAGAITASPGWRTHPLAAVSVVVLTAGVAVLAPVVVVDLPIHARTAEAAEAAPLAQRPGPRTWSWQPPAAVRELVAAGNGVVVALGNGSVAGLDGPTGAVRWQHTRVGTHVRALVPTPDRATVLVAFDSSGGYDTGTQLLVALDATTGAVRHERLVDGIIVDIDEIAPTARILPLRERRQGDDFRTLGYDIATGELRWTWEAPAGCTSPFVLIASGRDTALAPLSCPDRLALVGLDERTGAVRWQHELRTTAGVPEEREDMFLDASPDGALVSLVVSSPRLTPGVAHRAVLDTATGAVVTEVDPKTWAQMSGGPVPLIARETENANWAAVESVDPATRTRRPLDDLPRDSGGCEVRQDYATTTTSFISVCWSNQAEIGDLTLVTQDFAGGPRTSVPVHIGGDNEWAPNLFDRSGTAVVAAPGAIVVARATRHDAPPALVVGLAVA